MSLILLFHCLLLNMFRMLVYPYSGACDLLRIYLMCCVALVRCVLVLRCGSAGVVWYPDASWNSANASHGLPYAYTLPNLFKLWRRELWNIKNLSADSKIKWGIPRYRQTNTYTHTRTLRFHQSSFHLLLMFL